MTHERLERRFEEREGREEREAKHARHRLPQDPEHNAIAHGGRPCPDDEHRAEPATDWRGVLSCSICGEAVRQWPDGRFPLHARI